MIGQLSTVIVKCFLKCSVRFLSEVFKFSIFICTAFQSVLSACFSLVLTNISSVSLIILLSQVLYNIKVRLQAAGKWIYSSARCIFIYCTQSCCPQFREYKQVTRHCTRGKGLACTGLESLKIKVRFPQCSYSTALSNETNYHQVLKSDHISPADCT